MVNILFLGENVCATKAFLGVGASHKQQLAKRGCCDAAVIWKMSLKILVRACINAHIRLIS